ncbi:MAG: hypothetical protein WA830_20335 [Candidatus Sulfotelmatobacter sp.]
MKCRHNQRLVIAAVGAKWFSITAALAKAVHYFRAAQKDERNGFRYTAAMEWQLAAGLFASNTLAAEYCWRQWERIVRLPRRLAGPIGDFRAVLPEEPIRVAQSGMEPSDDDIFLAASA